MSGDAALTAPVAASVVAPVAIVMGSQSDWAVMRHAALVLDELGVRHVDRIVSAHRTPERLFAFARQRAPQALFGYNPDYLPQWGRLVKEYKAAMKRFRASDLLNDDELEYIANVYSNLADQSLKNLDALAMVITAGKTRMSDDERIHAVEQIFRDMEDKLSFLRWFNNSGAVLLLQRAKETSDAKVMKKLYGF